MHQRSLFSLAEHRKRLSKDGDPLKVLAGTVEFERFRPLLVKGLGYSDGAKGGRPAFAPPHAISISVATGPIAKAEFPSFTPTKELIPMTEDRLPLAELLAKSRDGDFLRTIAESVLQIIMEADVEGMVGAARHERSGDRTT